MSLFWASKTERTASIVSSMLSVALFLITLVVAGAAAAGPLEGGRIGYVLTERHWALYETEGAKTECPQGFNIGPREQFDELFRKDSGVEWTIAETRLIREGRRFHLTTSDEPFPFYDAQGQISYGLNLDGKVGADDFRSPDGDEGIDNQLARAIGCIAIYREGGTLYHFENLFMLGNTYYRWMIELSGVDDLVNDEDVTVTFYRGLDDLVTDASGNDFVAGGTQRVDERWGQSFIQEVKGKIVDGVLTTEPTAKQTRIPWSRGGFQEFVGFQLKLKLTQQAAEGMLAGYVDVEHFNHQLNRGWTTHHQSYGQLSSPSLYRSMRRLADAYPDPETGANTAISSAVNVTLTQVYVVHPGEEKSIAGQ